MLQKLHRASLFAVLWAAACSHVPTAPSRNGAHVDGGVAGPLSSWASQNASITVADWGCLTAGVGCPLRAEFDMPAVEDAPGVPASLAAQVSGSTVTLTWSAPVGGGAPATYVLEAGTAAGQSNIASFATGGTTTTFTATSVPNGTYFIRVRARNTDGTSGPSNEATVVVGGGGGCQPPGAPPALFTAAASGNTVTLSWTAVAGALGYVIEAGTSAGASNIIVFDTGTTGTSFTGNAPNGTYYLRVRVRTACGTSAASNEAALTVGSAPPPTDSLTGLWRGTNTTTITVTRQPPVSIEVDLVQTGTRVTGTVRGQAITFDLTQSCVGCNVFRGTMRVQVGCPQNKTGTLSRNATTLSGGFSGLTCDARPDLHELSLTKVQ